MPTTNNITTTYVGKDSGQFISPILMAGRTLGVPGVTIKKNVNYRSRITKLALSDLIQDASCDFDPSGTVDQTELWLEVKQLEVNLELCKSDYFNDFIGEDMGPADKLNVRFLSYLVGEVGGNVADAIETMVWQGTDVAGSFEGFETKFAANADVIDVVGQALTASNVIAEIRKMTAQATAAMPAILGKSDTYLYMGAKAYQVLREANNDKNSASPCGENCLSVDGIKIFYAPGMKPENMALAQKSNLFFGTWSTSNLQSIKVKDMSELLEDNVRMAMSFFAGTEVGYGAEVVYYAQP